MAAAMESIDTDTFAENGSIKGSPTLPAEDSATGRSASAATADEEHLCFQARYSKVMIEVRLGISDTVQDLKAILFSMTDVPPERQKILGLVRSKLPADETQIGSLVFPPASLRESPHPITGEKRITISLLGTPLDQTFKDPVYDDLTIKDKKKGHEKFGDFDYSNADQVKQLSFEPRNDRKAQEKLRKAISRFSHTFPIMHEPRNNLKGGLLVLDLDYTMVDTKRLLHYSTSPREAERPGLHEFLASVYPYYDICVWSQTSYWWLEAKLTELGCLTHDKYRILFALDRTPMFTVRNEDSTRKRKHEVKALEIIWKRFEGVYGPHNTIHIDDLARNFAMNPECGLKIKAFRKSDEKMSACDSNGNDVELFAVRDYLLKLAHSRITNFQQLQSHHQWRVSTLPSVHEEENRIGREEENDATAQI